MEINEKDMAYLKANFPVGKIFGSPSIHNPAICYMMVMMNDLTKNMDRLLKAIEANGKTEKKAPDIIRRRKARTEEDSTA